MRRVVADEIATPTPVRIASRSPDRLTRSDDRSFHERNVSVLHFPRTKPMIRCAAEQTGSGVDAVSGTVDKPTQAGLGDRTPSRSASELSAVAQRLRTAPTHHNVMFLP